MDQLKRFLVVLKKHHFWVLSAIIPLLAFYAWWSATSAASTQFKDSETKIEGSFDLLKFDPTKPIPNPTFIKGAARDKQTVQEGVLNAWTAFYENQSKYTKWPSEVSDIEKLNPGEPIPESTRVNYQNLVPDKEWERLFLVADVRRPKIRGGNKRIRDMFEQGNNNQGEQFEGIVNWNEASREELKERYHWEQTPSDTQVRLAQEDLWIYESLMNIIRNSNRDATDPLNAVVKEIEKINIAQWAIDAAESDPGTIDMVADNMQAGPKSSSDMMSAMPKTSEMLVPGTGAAATGDPRAMMDTMLLDGRYLDAAGEPLAAKGPQPFAEFKQVFVDMSLVVDQRKLPNLLAECANAPIPLEVRQVRINPGAGGGAAGGAGRAPGAMGGMGRAMSSTPRPSGGAGRSGASGSGMPRPSGGSGSGGAGRSGMPRAPGAGMGAGAGGADIVEQGPYDVPVSIRGVVYIYNPPDQKKLGTGTGSKTRRNYGLPTKPVAIPTEGGTPGMGGASRGGSMSAPPSAMTPPAAVRPKGS